MADIPESTKMEVTRTPRGFAVARGVDRYAAPYSIQDSSLAEEAAIWLGSDADTGGRAHLTQDMAAGLIPLLQAFVATGSIAGSADTIAAPPAMDREAVGLGDYVLVPAVATREMVDAADACVDAYSAYAAMVQTGGRKPILAADVLTEEWLADVLQDTLEMDWTTTDGARGIVRALKNGLVTFPQSGGQILSTLSADAIRQGEGLRALSDRATPGPWSWEQCGEQEDVPVVGIAFPGDDPDCKAPYEGEFRDSDASRMTIAFDWQSCDGHSPSANAAFAVAAVNFVRGLIATPASHASDGGKA